MMHYSNEASYCSSAGDPSPQYSALALRTQHITLLRTALTQILQTSTMCSMVADQVLAIDPTTKQPLLSAEHIQAYGGAWVCNHTAMADMLCDGGQNGGAAPIRDCSQCGKYMEQFAGRVKAGATKFTRSDVVAFCMEINSQQQSQPGDGSNQQDPLAVPDVADNRCTTDWQRYRYCNVSGVRI